MDEYRVSVHRGLHNVAAADWDALLGPNDAPLLSWAYLEGLENAGCVGGTTSWQPAHLLVRKLPTARSGGAAADAALFATATEAAKAALANAGELVAAAPAYVKYDSDGEWVYDFDWAAFAESQGIAYYPKLVLSVPFNPVSGGRLLTRPDLPASEQEALQKLLLQAAKRLCEKAGFSSAHVLFPREVATTMTQLLQSEFLLRQQEQYHFLNRYRSFEDFLANLRAHRRNSIRRERRALLEAHITVRTYRGLGDAPTEFSRQQIDCMYDLYANTSQRYVGTPPYLNRRFFQLCAERLGDRLELVLAHDRDGVLLGGAWNLRGDTRLFGRHFGKTDASPPFLHFEVCYYHSVERCISEGLLAFEPGHGGEHKLIRGFTPVLTHSAHYLHDLTLRRPIAAFLAEEAPLVLGAVNDAKKRCPLQAAPNAASATRHLPASQRQNRD